MIAYRPAFPYVLTHHHLSATAKMLQEDIKNNHIEADSFAVFLSPRIYGQCGITASTFMATLIWRFLARSAAAFVSELEGEAENEMFKSSPNLSAAADSC